MRVEIVLETRSERKDFEFEYLNGNELEEDLRQKVERWSVLEPNRTIGAVVAMFQEDLSLL